MFFCSKKWFWMEFRTFLSSAVFFGTKLRSSECFSLARNSSEQNSELFYFCWMARNGIPRVFQSLKQTEFQLGCAIFVKANKYSLHIHLLVYSLRLANRISWRTLILTRNNFFRKMATLLGGQHNHSWTKNNSCDTEDMQTSRANILAKQGQKIF
jgi:hypothetical protein